tara:strand:- start:294 stop:575 length:282 start_codon:yes stop_codon:yes gene_type:complete
MHKDNFYYILRNRLEYANDFVKESSDWLKSVEFQNRVDEEFHKNIIFLKIILKIINMPTIIYKYFNYLKGTYNYYRAVKEVEMLKRELKKYEK